jgi:hypothetical protein
MADDDRPIDGHQANYQGALSVPWRFRSPCLRMSRNRYRDNAACLITAITNMEVIIYQKVMFSVIRFSSSMLIK